MISLEDINTVECQYRAGHPSLGEALGMLMARWTEGARDEETALRLLFLLWFTVVEPPVVTGLTGDINPAQFLQVFEQAGGESGASPHVLFAVGKMAQLFPWAIGNEAEWAVRAERLIAEALAVQPSISARSFAGRGAAGDYLAHILTAEVRAV